MEQTRPKELICSGQPTSGNVIAYASHCQTTGTQYSATNPTPGRPIAGFINFGSQAASTLNFNDEDTRQAWIRTGIHEVMHALGYFLFFLSHSELIVDFQLHCFQRSLIQALKQ